MSWVRAQPSRPIFYAFPILSLTFEWTVRRCARFARHEMSILLSASGPPLCARCSLAHARARPRCSMRQQIMKAIFQFGPILSFLSFPLLLSPSDGSSSSLSLTSDRPTTTTRLCDTRDALDSQSHSHLISLSFLAGFRLGQQQIPSQIMRSRKKREVATTRGVF